MAGRVVLVGTPIGNLADLSARAVEVLREADVICCEDTRRTLPLLNAAGIVARRMVTLHRHNEAAASEAAVGLAREGSTVAFVSDAGMPGISDPGGRLVRAAVEAGVEVGVVPGPSAVVTALALSGMPADRFCFEGFLPRSGGQRAARLAAIATEPRTSVIYEAPHRAARTISDLARCCGNDRPLVVAREMTKLHEQVWRGTFAGAIDWLESEPPRGEWVIVVAGAPARAPADDEIRAALGERLSAGAKLSEAVADVVADLRASRRLVYDTALSMRSLPNEVGGALPDDQLPEPR